MNPQHQNFQKHIPPNKGKKESQQRNKIHNKSAQAKDLLSCFPVCLFVTVCEAATPLTLPIS